ncbi:MAG: dTDP-4-dehydrorhamnose reductase [Pseudolabrys sp.]|jgi:dTDP-4-dehydrorhamnose reductase|nr:dTDP-4-dehydrorhamnose reductase [Pseudolabrys sp.]
MRVLIMGVTGQVGAALAPLFKDFAEVVPAPRAVLDLSDAASIPARLDALAPELIVNPAAYTAVDNAETDRDVAFAINAAAPGVIAAWAAGHRVPLIHFSTDYVFDGSGNRPWREDDATGPLNVYGESKLAGEHAVRHSGASALIVRTSWVYSAGGKNFLRTMVNLMREKPELRIVDDQTGAPTSAHQIASAVAAIVHSHVDDLPRAFAASKGAVHLVASGITTWHGFAEAILTGLQERGMPAATCSIARVASKDYPVKAQRPLNSRLDLSRLRDVFGIVPEPWETALARELDLIAAK